MAPKTPARSRAAVAVEAAAPAPTPAKSARGKGKKAAKLADEVAEAEAAALVEPDIQRDLEQLERSLTASLRTQLRLPSVDTATSSPTAGGAGAGAERLGRLPPTVLRTGFEDTPLYLSITADGGAVMTAAALELPGTDVVDNELSEVMKKAVVTPDLEKRHAVPPLNPKKEKGKAKDNAGDKWFNMPAPEMTEEVKRDLQLIKMRNVLDPKRFYKKGEKKLPKYFQFGTVVESGADYYSGRLVKRERKKTIVDELLADDQRRSYYKRKFAEVQERQAQAPRRKFAKAKHGGRKRA